MSDEISMTITLPTDDEGMIGRECPECRQYFKVKPGTGLDVPTCTCPYCEHTDDAGEFLTQAQLEYATSLAAREVLGPSLQELERRLRRMERASQHSLIQIHITGTGFDIPLQYYNEEDLETTVECDSCGLMFAIYGVFASCPDCSRPITMSMFKSALKVARKRLGILEKIPAQETDLRGALLADTLCGGVATFDSLGKRLRGEFPTVFPTIPRNLFQNLDALSQALRENMSLELSELIGEDRYSKLYYMFQLRHIWSHNFGEVDEGFVQKTNSDPNLIGTTIVPSAREVEEFLALVETLGLKLRSRLSDRT
jgi:Zn ribbon nucleic-acid-binding protein